MPGSFDLSDSRPPLASNALTVGVYRYAPPSSYSLLPNIRCVSIEHREGPDPPVCRLEYIMDDSLSLNLGWPGQFEELWPIDARGAYVLNPDDRIVVAAVNPDDSPWILFDGFAQIPQADVTPQSQRVTFTAVGVAVRCFDDVITGRTQRDSDKNSLLLRDGKADRLTDLPTRFNPADNSVADGNKGGYIPNRTDGTRATGPTTRVFKPPDDSPYHVFLDPQIERDPDPRDWWTVADAVTYLLKNYNEDQEFVKMSNKELDFREVLQAHYPAEGHDTMNPNDETTFASDPIKLRDYEATNKPWPEAVSELLSYCGFVMRFDTGQDSQGNPKTDLRFYRRDEFNTVAPKLVYLAASNPTDRPDVDPSRSNVIALHLARDMNGLVNAWEVETAQRKVELSVILAPLYEPAIADKQAAARREFYTGTWNATTTAIIRRKYRWYGVDELGDGHYTGGNWVTDSQFDFGAVFPPNKETGENSYVVRYRPGSHRIASMDSGHHPLKSELAVSFDYSGPSPGIWDGTGTWQAVPGGWHLLDDRLGIQATQGDLSEWALHKSTVPNAQTKINGINYWADPPAGIPTNGKAPIFRLTTVIEDDIRMGILAEKRMVSPSRFTRWRSADARDHFQYNTVHPKSLYAKADGGNDTDPWVIRDDTNAAKAHAYQLRSSHEFPVLAGSVTLPFLTGYYEVGDRIQMIRGRDVSLRVNVGVEQNEAPVYPWVVAVAWNLEGDRQTTTLQLSDARAQQRPNL